MVDLSVVVPGIRRHQWERFYQSLVQSCPGISFEVVFVGPFEDPGEVVKHPNVKYMRSFRCPTACINAGSTVCTGRNFTYVADDVLYEPGKMAETVKFADSLPNATDVVIIKYIEGPNFQGNEQPVDYWRGKYHDNMKNFAYPDNWLLALAGMYKLDYFKQLGGFDCSYEVMNVAICDLSFRAQNCGSKLHLSPSVTFRCDWDVNAPEYHIIMEAYHTNDKIIFERHWGNSSYVTRKTLPYDNWKYTPRIWRRFDKEIV